MGDQTTPPTLLVEDRFVSPTGGELAEIDRDLAENSRYYRPLFESRPRGRGGLRLPCWLFGGHRWYWLDPRRESGLWFVKKRCGRCSQERDYQIGESSEGGHRWSAAGGSAPPPRRYWALNAHNHPEGLKRAGEFIGGLALLVAIAGVVLGLVAVVAVLVAGLAQEIKPLERPVAVGEARVGELLEADPGSWRYEDFDFLFIHSDGEPYHVAPEQWRYTWQRCHNGHGGHGGGCSDIAGATEATYRLRKADAGKHVRVVVKVGPPEGKLLYKDLPAQRSATRRVLGS